MGFGLGLSRFAQGMKSGMDDIEARGLREKQEARQVAADQRQLGLDARQTVENQQRDTVFARNTEQYERQKADVDYQKKFDGMMRSLVLSKGEDLLPTQNFINQNTANTDGSMVSLSTTDDGAIAYKSMNADGTIRQDKTLQKKEFLESILAFKDPTAWIKAAQAHEQAQAERAAVRKEGMEDWGTKQITENSFKANDDAREFQQEKELAKIKAMGDAGVQRIKNQGAGKGKVFNESTQQWEDVNKPLTEAQRRANNAIQNARIVMDKVNLKDQAWLKEIDAGGFMMANPKYNPQIEAAYKLANQTRFGGDEAQLNHAINPIRVRSDAAIPQRGLQPSVKPPSQGLPKQVQPAKPGEANKKTFNPDDYVNAKWAIDVNGTKKTYTYADVLQTARETGQTPEQVMKAAGMR